MRALFFRFAGIACAFAAAAACAASGSNNSGSNGPPDDGGAAIPDAPTPDAAIRHDASFDALPETETCSAAGWCSTPLPDVDLQFLDVWPLPNRAFAFAAGETRGIKLMEWSDAAGWRYIDEGTLNALNTLALAPGALWAPSGDEVYVAMLHYGLLFGLPDGFGGYVFRGKRPVPPATKWTWTRYDFDCDTFDFSPPAVGGTSKSDVHVAYCGTVHRLDGADGDGGADAGSSSWVPEYVDGDQTSFLALTGSITGTAPDDTWFLGYRGEMPGACTVILHKTSGGIETVADGTLMPDGTTCAEIPGKLLIDGGLRQIHATSTGHVVGVRASESVGNDVVRIVRGNDGSYSVSSASPAPTFNVLLQSIWGASDDDLWLLADDPNGTYGILRGTNLWSGASSYQYSTLVMNDLPNRQPLSKIRGTSNDNLWAVGYERAFHKKTP